MEKFIEWSIEEKTFELKYNWKLSRNETIEKTNLFVSLNHLGDIAMGEIAPNIRYKESPISIKKEFDFLLTKGLNEINHLNKFHEFIGEYTISNALKFGLESAITAHTLKTTNTSFSSFFNIKNTTNSETSYTIPIMNVSNIESFISDNKLDRFSSLKLKINNEEPLDFIKEVSKYYPKTILIDANEAWKDVDQLINFLNKLNNFNIELVEQPMPSSQIEEYFYLKKYAPYPIFGDESVIDQEDLEDIAKQFHGINFKLMKTGGFTKTLSMIKSAKKLGLKTMIGCMVESTMGISSALNLASEVDYVDLDGFMLIKNEPFGLIKEENGILYLN